MHPQTVLIARQIESLNDTNRSAFEAEDAQRRKDPTYTMPRAEIDAVVERNKQIEALDAQLVDLGKGPVGPSASTPDEIRRATDVRHRALNAVAPAAIHARAQPSAHEADRGVALGASESFAAWSAEEHGLRHDLDGLSLGSFARSLITGARTHAESTALQESQGADGGYLVPAPLAAEFIDRLRARAVVFRAGARVVPMTSATLAIARLSDDPAAAWRAELESGTDATPQFDRVTFTARTLRSLVKASRELIEDAPNLEEALNRAFAGVLAAELDRVCFVGTGTPPEPRGIKNTSGIQEIAYNAEITDYDPIVDAMQMLQEANANAPTAAIMAPRDWSGFAKLKAGTDGQPLRKPDAIADLPFLVGSQLPIAEDEDESGPFGPSSSIYVADFTQLLVGVRTQLGLEVIRDRNAEEFAWSFRAWLRADVQLAHEESFVRITGVSAPATS